MAESEQRLGLSLGLRLSLMFALFYAVAMLALLWAVNLVLVRWVTAAEQRIVEERAEEFAAWYREGGVSALAARFERQAAQRPEVVFLRVTSRRSQVLFVHSPHGEALMKPELLQNLPYNATMAHYAADPADPGSRWTVRAQPLGDALVLQVGKNSREAESVLRAGRRLLVWSILPISVVAIGLGTFTTYRSLRPLRSLMEAMFEIHRTGNWGRRVHLERRLDPDLVRLSELFNALLDRNEQLIKAMHESLDNVAHDLRTPMARLRAAAESALEEPDPASGRNREALRDCLEESGAVLHLLEDLMELGEAETGGMRLHRQEFAAGEVLEAVADLYEFVAEEAGVELRIEWRGEGMTGGDRIRLQRALANLVDNALKHAPSGSEVVLRAESLDGGTRFSVSDGGPGLPVEGRERIWDRLHRLDPSRSQRGLGLGLSFVRAIALAHDGRYGVESELGEGATFWIWVPIKGREPNEPGRTGLGPGPGP